MPKGESSTSSVARPHAWLAWALVMPAFLLAAGFSLAGCSREGTSTTASQTPTNPTATTLAASTGCVVCHDGLETAHLRYPLGCAQCHGGNPNSTIKDVAHVQPQADLPSDASILDRDYPDVQYLRFINPSDFRVVRTTCGQTGQGLGTACHSSFAPDVQESIMAQTPGVFTLSGYEAGLLDENDTPWGIFAETSPVDPDAEGAVPALDALPGFDNTYGMTSFERHFSDIQGKACASCHLWSRGSAVRGESGHDGFYRSEGCASCHMEYTDSGLSESLDPTIDKSEPGHPRIHQLSKQISTKQCAHCHTASNHTGLAYQGLAKLPPNTPTGANFDGLTSEPVYGEYHIENSDIAPADVHMAAGMACIDCHVLSASHGDGNIYTRMSAAVETDCRDCHGDNEEYGTMMTERGTVYENLRWENDDMILTGKIDGVERVVPQVKDLVDLSSPDFNVFAWRYMNSDHLKGEGGLECQTCHSGWQHNSYGTHVKRDLTGTQLDPLTGEETDGIVDVSQRFLLSFRSFHMGYNSDGRIAPVASLLQPILSVTGYAGEPLLEQKLPVTPDDLSGLTLKPVQPHTTTRGSRVCQECHTNPAALGLGTDSFSLTRRHLYAIGAAEPEADSTSPTSPPINTDGISVEGGRFLVVDRSDATAPSVVGELELTAPVDLLALTDSRTGDCETVYVSDSTSGLVVVDTSNPVSPAVLSTHEVASPTAMARSGQTLFIAAGLNGVHSWDISEPTAPEFISTLDTADARGLHVHGVHLLIADGSAGLTIAKIEDDGSTEIVTTLDLNGSSSADNQANDVFAFPHYGNPQIAGLKPFRMIAYVADGDRGIRVVSIEEMDDPDVIRTVSTDNAKAVFAQSQWFPGNETTESTEREFLFVADGEGGIRVLNILNPTFPLTFETVSDIGDVRDLHVANALEDDTTKLYVYTALGSGGGKIFDFSDISNPVQVSNLPLQSVKALDIERVQLDRYVDEEGNPVKDMSHDEARPFTREEMLRILEADL